MNDKIKVGDLWAGTSSQWTVVKSALIIQVDAPDIAVGVNDDKSDKWPIKAWCLRQFPGESLSFAMMRFSVAEILSFEKVCGSNVSCV